MRRHLLTKKNKNDMKKSALLSLLLACTLSLSAQSKQDLQNTINNLNQQVGQLKAMLEAKSEQLDQANQTIADLRQKLASGAVAAQKPATYRDSIADLIEKYTNCASWEEALKYVMEPERVRPIMQKYYANQSFSPTIWTAEQILKEVFKRFSGKSHTIYKCLNFYAVQTPDGYRLDWEATVEYNPVTHTELADKIGQSAEIRGCFHFASYYDNDYFRGFTASGMYNTEGNSAFFLTEKGSAIDKRLFSMLKNGADIDMILKMKSLRDSDGYQYFLITDIISNSFSKY